MDWAVVDVRVGSLTDEGELVVDWGSGGGGSALHREEKLYILSPLNRHAHAHTHAHTHTHTGSVHFHPSL